MKNIYQLSLQKGDPFWDINTAEDDERYERSERENKKPKKHPMKDADWQGGNREV